MRLPGTKVKTVLMLENCPKNNVFPLKVLCSAIIAEKRAKELDIALLNDISNEESSCSEYNGYNTRITRVERVAMKPKTRAVYLPLINMPPSDPDTIMTALHETKQKRGQKNTIFTCEEQLYKVAVEMKWAHPNDFSEVIFRLGGMHMFISFVSAVGTLMQGSGLSEVLESTFAGVAKMTDSLRMSEQGGCLLKSYLEASCETRTSLP